MPSLVRARRRRRSAVVILIGLALACAVAIGVRNYHGAHLLLEADPPSALLGSPERTGIGGLRSVAFQSSDRIRISAWYLPPPRGAVIVVTHGTNSDRSTMLAELRILAGAGFGVLALDWPGLGDSAGPIRWNGQARRALTAAIDWLSSRPEVDTQRIGGLGFSIGGFIMTQVAAQDSRLRAVVLEAVVPSFEDYLQVHNTRWGILGKWPARWAMQGSGLLDPDVAPIVLIKRIAPRPLLLIAGSADREVPAALVARLYESAGMPKTLWVVPGAQHGGYADIDEAGYASRISGFFAKTLSGTAGRD